MACWAPRRVGSSPSAAFPVTNPSGRFHFISQAGPTVSASADHVDVAAPAARAAPPQADQGHVAAASRDEGREVCVGLMVAVPADQQDPDEARCGEGRSSMKPGEWQAEVLAMGAEGDLH
jgi:hypothetical protein